MAKRKSPPVTFATAEARAAAFTQAKATHDALEADYKKALATIKAIPGHASGPMGLTPDSVRLTPEYRKAYFALQKAMTVQRDFAEPFVKTFKKELIAERDERRRKIQEANQSEQASQA